MIMAMNLKMLSLIGLGIEKIKLKEKNSNTEDDKSIESKENTKQVFGEKNNDLDELKDGLVEILDISIETIQID